MTPIRSIRIWVVRVTLLLSWLAIFSTATLAGNGSEGGDHGRRLALVIGNSHYQSLPVLKNAAPDAQLVAASLEKVGFSVKLVTDGSIVQMNAAIDQMAAGAEAGDHVVFYYSGHGFQLDGINYIVPVDAVLTSTDAINSSTLRLNRALAKLQSAGRQTIALVDACRDNPLPPQLRGDRTVNGLAKLGDGLAPDLYVAFATSPGNVSLDGSGDHGPFAAALARYLPQPHLPIYEVMRSVRNQVMSDTANAQIPTVEESLLQPFYFNGAPQLALQIGGSPPVVPGATDGSGPSAGTPSPPDPGVAYDQAVKVNTKDAYQAFLTAFHDPYYGSLAQQRLNVLVALELTKKLQAAPLGDVYWMTIRRSTVIGDFEAYLRRFPAGPNADLARARVLQLQRSQEVVDALTGPDAQLDPEGLRRAAEAKIDSIPVNMIQYGLVALGFLVTDINGIIDAPTRQAIRNYQASIDAPQTGRLSPQETVDVLLNAAATGDASSQTAVGTMLAQGVFWQKSYFLARLWLGRAADQNNPYALTNLAVIYKDGLGVPVDMETAQTLLKRAVALGSSDAATLLRSLNSDDGQQPAAPSAPG